jgi:hypothetical protein
MPPGVCYTRGMTTGEAQEIIERSSGEIGEDGRFECTECHARVKWIEHEGGHLTTEGHSAGCLVPKAEEIFQRFAEAEADGDII